MKYSLEELKRIIRRMEFNKTEPELLIKLIEEAKTMLEIEDLYRKYMRIRRVLSTEREIKSVAYMLEREGIDFRVRNAVKKLLEKKIELEMKLVEKIIDEVVGDVEE